MAQRCVFCKKKLDEKGRCQNKSCVDYKRTQILEEQDKIDEAKKKKEKKQGKVPAFIHFLVVRFLLLIYQFVLVIYRCHHW